MARDDRDIDGAALGDFADAALPPALGQAGDEKQPRRIGEGLK